MLLPYPKAVVFDWDNTLVDSWGPIAAAMNYTRQAMGLPVWTFEEVKKNCTRSARESFPEWFGAEWQKAYEIYYKDFDEERRKRDIKVLPGSHELLLSLKEKSIPAFVVSNKRGDYLRYEAEKLKWQSLFVAIVGAQDAPRDKPARDHVDHALNHGHIFSDMSVWFIGDSETDILCARNAGCTPILIGEAGEAERLSVDFVFSDCQGVQRLINKLSH